MNFEKEYEILSKKYNLDEIKEFSKYLMIVIEYTEVLEQNYSLVSYMQEFVDKEMLYVYTLDSLKELESKNIDSKRLVHNILYCVLVFMRNNNIKHIRDIDSLKQLIPKWKLKELLSNYLNYCL